MKKDRLVAGGIAGFIGSLIQNAYGQITKALGITDRAFIDFAEIVLAREVYGGLIGFIVGTLAHAAVGVLMGVIFSFIIKFTSSRYYLLKGAGFGFILWFLLSGFGTIFNLANFAHIPPNTALSTLGGALIFGLVTAFTLGYLDRRTGLLWKLNSV